MINKKRMLKTFLELVKIDSESRKEKKVADYILKKISDLKISNLLDLYDRLFHEPKTVLSIIGPDQKDFSNLNL